MEFFIIQATDINDNSVWYCALDRNDITGSYLIEKLDRDCLMDKESAEWIINNRDGYLDFDNCNVEMNAADITLLSTVR